MESILSILALFVGILAAVLLIPMASAFALGLNVLATNLLVCVLLYWFVALGTRQSLRTLYKPINRRQAMILAVLTWLLLPLLAILPFMLAENLGVIEAFYEATSALTTTGHSFLKAEQLLAPMILWRALLGWIGGLLTLGFLVNVIAPNNVGGSSVAQLRLLWHGSETNAQNLFKEFSDILVPFTILTLMCFVLLILVGNEPFASFILALSALSTSGFLGNLGGIEALDSGLSELVLVIFMLAGGTSILWHRMIVMRQRVLLAEHRESYCLIGLILGMTILGVLLWLPDDGAMMSKVRHLFFEVTSIVTTSGMSYDNNSLLLMPTVVMLILSVMGACSFSTGGGIKLSRIGALITQALHELQQLVYPNAIIDRRLMGSMEPLRHFKAVWSSLFAYFLVALVAVGGITIAGPGLEDGLAIAFGALSNSSAVLAQGIVFFEQTGIDSVPLWLLPFISIVMILGRLELLVILAAISRIKW